MFLKYPGSKKRSVDHLIKLLGNGHRLVDPFCGSAALFFKSDYKEYLLCDINADVINLYQYVKDDWSIVIPRMPWQLQLKLFPGVGVLSRPRGL